MALKQTNEISEVFLQTEMYVKPPDYIMKTNKSNSSGIKYGLTELSNDKFYLETELPARKRFRPETELFNTTKHKICKEVGNAEWANFVNEEKCSVEIRNILFSESAFENNPKKAESDLCKNLDKNRIPYQGEIEFEDEINKCCELLNLDVPRLAVVETTATKSGNRQIHKCKIDNLKDKKQSLDILNTQPIKLVDGLHSASQDGANLRVISVDKKLKMQDKLLNKRENGCKDTIYFKNEYNSIFSTVVNSNSFSTMRGENYIDRKEEIFQNENNTSVEEYSLESKFRFNDKNNSTLKINEISNLNNISVKKPNTCISEMIQNQDNQSNSEHLDLATKNTLRGSDKVNFKETNQENISQDHLNDEISSVVSDSGDTLILYDGSDIDFDETKEISQTNASESAQANNNDATALVASLDNGTIRSNTSNEVKKKGNSVSSKNINPLDENLPLDNMNAEPTVLEGISNNDRIGNINALNAKVDELFVSEYEISLLVDDTDSIFSEQSIDSEYEISLLEDDINDEGNQDDSLDSEYEVSLLEGDINDEENLDESFDSEYEVSLLEDDINDKINQNDMDENKSDSSISPKYLPNSDEEEKITPSLLRQTKESKTEHSNDQTTNIDNLCEKEIDVVFENNTLNANKNTKTEEHFTTITDGKIVLKLENSTTLTSEILNVVDDIIKKASSENKASPFQLKLESNNESQTQNKLILNSSEVRNSEEKSINVTSNMQHAGSFSIDSTIIERSVKTEVDIFNTGESKDANDTFKLSNKVVLMNKTERSEEKELIVSKNKQLTESTSIGKAVGEKTTKTDLAAIASSELNDVNNKFQSSNKGVPMKETKRSEDKATIVDRNKQLAHIKRVSIDKTIDEKTVKTDLSLSANSELKDVNKKSQPSIKEELINKTKRSEEKALIVDTNKQLTRSTSTDKATSEKIVKIHLGVSASSELKREAENIIPDYYEDEKDDLINPGWNKIKELSTDEERYRQVRDCWESKIIPNPFKNLTYYSYRKRKINHGENNTHQTKQHKRHASNNLNGNNAKRSRTCTYIFDDRIESIKKVKEKKAQRIQNKMNNEVNWLNQQCLQEERRLQNLYEYNYDPRRQQFELHDLRREFQQRISSITAEYEQKVYSCCDQYTSEINSLKNNRNEVFQFYNFYKGLNPDEYKDPTILTNEQLQELEEIENIYIQMDHHYK